MEKAWNSMIQSIQHHLWNTVEQCDAGACLASSGSGLLLFSDDVTEQKTEAAGWILKCTGIYSLSRFSQMQQIDWAALHSTNGQWPKTYIKSNPGVFEGKKVKYSAMAESISWSLPDWAAFHSLKTKLKTERPTNKQQLKSAAVKVWKSSTKKKLTLCWCPWVPDFRQSLTAKDSQQNIKN